MSHKRKTQPFARQRKPRRATINNSIPLNDMARKRQQLIDMVGEDRVRYLCDGCGRSFRQPLTEFAFYRMVYYLCAPCLRELNHDLKNHQSRAALRRIESGLFGLFEGDR